MVASIRSSANVFAALALDRAGEFRDDDAYVGQRRGAETARYIVLRPDGRALVDDARRALRALTEVERASRLPLASPTFLGQTEHSAWFATGLPDDADADAFAQGLGARWMDLRSAGLALPSFDAGLFAYARGVLFWHTRTRFCGACGAPTALLSSGHRARCTNPACGLEHFPRTDPAIIVIVGWRDACLLGRQASWPEGRWSTLAGFVEPGETLEDAVRREVHEEAGVRVDECDYHSSQPWPFPSSLMLGFTARASDPTIKVGSELDDARWFEVDDIVRGLADRTFVLPPPLSVSHRLIEHWLRETAGLELSSLANDEPWVAQRR